MKKCPNCNNFSVPNDAVFCPTCGFDFTARYYCKYCGKEIRYKDLFCKNCGLEQFPKQPLDKKTIEDALWRMYSSARGYKEYLERYPNGYYSKEALNRIDDNEWFSDSLTLDGCKKYLKLYPSGRHTQDALKKIESIKEERREKVKDVFEKIGAIVSLFS